MCLHGVKIIHMSFLKEETQEMQCAHRSQVYSELYEYHVMLS